ncbi:MAG: helix-turn-helix domain-containing protein [Phycisphaeraceae bacterium]
MDEVGEILNLKYESVRRLVLSGQLPAYNVGEGKQRARWRIARADLERWLEGRRHEPVRVTRPARRTKDPEAGQALALIDELMGRRRAG